MTLIGPLTGGTPSHWSYVPEAVARIRRFVRTFGTDQDPDALVQTFKAHFVAETGNAPLWLWLDEAGTPVGHLFAWLDSGRRRSLFVGQVWSDRALPEALRDSIVAALEAHARALGCWALEGWVENPAILRLYRKIGMATPVLTAVRRVVEPAVAAPKERALNVNNVVDLAPQLLRKERG